MTYAELAQNQTDTTVVVIVIGMVVFGLCWILVRMNDQNEK